MLVALDLYSKINAISAFKYHEWLILITFVYLFIDISSHIISIITSVETLNVAFGHTLSYAMEVKKIRDQRMKWNTFILIIKKIS